MYKSISAKGYTLDVYETIDGLYYMLFEQREQSMKFLKDGFTNQEELTKILENI